MVTFPIESFLPDADLTPLKVRKQEFYDGLTRAVSRPMAAASSALLSIEAASYEDALAKANNLFIARLWGDGLPLWPATRERVDWMLRGTPLPRPHVIGKFPPRGGIATVGACAIALVMTGGRPEYLLVLIAAVDAFLDPSPRSELQQATSGAPFPVVVVNGPLGGRYALTRASAASVPTRNTRRAPAVGARCARCSKISAVRYLAPAPWRRGATTATPTSYLPRMKKGCPKDGCHATERHGFDVGSNSVSLFFATGANNIKRRGAKKETKEEDTVQGLHRMAGFLAVPHYHYLAGYEKGTPGAMLLTRVVAGSLASLGWTKQKIREFLVENSRIPQEQIRRTGGRAWKEIAPDQPGRDSINFDPWPITAKPENLILIVAGGGHPTHSFWMQGNSPSVVGRMMRVPETFDGLLAEAERDLRSD